MPIWRARAYSPTHHQHLNIIQAISKAGHFVGWLGHNTPVWPYYVVTREKTTRNHSLQNDLQKLVMWPTIVVLVFRNNHVIQIPHTQFLGHVCCTPTQSPRLQWSSCVWPSRKLCWVDVNGSVYSRTGFRVAILAIDLNKKKHNYNVTCKLWQIWHTA